MPRTPSRTGLPDPADPPKDQAGKPLPEGIANFLSILHILLGYGQHLAATLESRAAHRSFGVIARCFGTARLNVILAHVVRGIRRTTALERVLHARAARGRDIVVPGVRSRPPPKANPAEAAPPSDQPAEDAAGPAAPHANALATTQPAAASHRRRTGPAEPPDLAYLPSVEELEAQIRRRPLARALADICRDFGVAPGFCTGWFWNRLFETLVTYDGGFAAFYNELFERQTSFARSDAACDPALQWPQRTREDTRQALGFFIGEEPVNPWAGHASDTDAANVPLTTGTIFFGRPEVGVALDTLVKAGLLPPTATGPP